MGVDYDAELIIGFHLNLEKMNEWLKTNNIFDDFYSDIDKLLQSKFPEIPEKKRNKYHQHISWSIYIVRYGNMYSEEYDYYLTFTKNSFKIKELENIVPFLFELGKKVYKDIIGEEPNCDKVDDLEIFPAIYIN
jgi:hypothetical protein